MPDKIDPKRVANKLAGGSPVQKNVLKINSGGSWVCKNIFCPHCGIDNPAYDREKGDKVICQNCEKEFKVIGEEEKVVDIKAVAESILREMNVLVNQKVKGKNNV